MVCKCLNLCLRCKMLICSQWICRPRSSAKRKVLKESEYTDDGADGQTSKKPRKKRSPPPGYVPFKQIIIPTHWKLFPESESEDNYNSLIIRI